MLIHRVEAEVHSAVTAVDSTSAVCYPGCSREQIPEDEEVIVPGSEQSGETNSGPPADKNLLGNQEQQELKGHAANSMAQIPQQQVKDTGDGSLVEVDWCPTMSSLQVNAMPKNRNEKKEALICDADDRASSTNLQSAEFSCGPVDVCDVTVSPGGSERKNSVRFNYAFSASIVAIRVR